MAKTNTKKPVQRMSERTPQTPAAQPVLDTEVTRSEMELIADIVLKAVPDVSPNPAQVDWPTDPWGLTKDLRDAITRLGSRIAGHVDKKELVNQTLVIALAHLEVKFEQDADALNARLEAALQAEQAE